MKGYGKHCCRRAMRQQIVSIEDWFFNESKQILENGSIINGFFQIIIDICIRKYLGLFVSDIKRFAGMHFLFAKIAGGCKINHKKMPGFHSAPAVLNEL